MNEGKTGAVIFYNVNPVYNYSEPKLLLDGLKKVELTVSMAMPWTKLLQFVELWLPTIIFLSRGTMLNLKKDFSVCSNQQLTIFTDPPGTDSLLKWAGSTTLFSAYLKQYWQQNFIGKQSEYTSASDF